MGKACYLQVNDFDRMRNRFILPAPSLEVDSKVQKHLLLDGDILLAAKGLSNFSSVYHENMGKSVASSSFLVISIIDNNVIIPDYLCWILNKEDSITYFQSNAAGSSIPSISKTMVEDYEINIPCIQTQRKIVEISLLQQQEQQLYQQLSSLHKKLISNQLNKITKE